MVSFRLDAVKNPVMETRVIQPTEDSEPITFTLRPCDTDIALKSLRVDYSLGGPNYFQDLLTLGIARIAGWQGVQDQDGEEVEFNSKNLGLLLSMPDFLPYVLEIGRVTQEVDIPMVRGKGLKKTAQAPPQEPPQPKAPDTRPEVSPSSSPTS